eukprot:TRINITY_DN470_c0_g1_i1.p1 TRINITY_DN470_c0_g1~~TRINITY_DN470_c0_g1_i1.p1  ORF type:complete len:791 (-),score=275.80 TRINITY_DN470_c0_g1_i1:2022-4346(-)
MTEVGAINTASKAPTIFWTITDEAPALATRSLLPIVSMFLKKLGVNLEKADISLAARVLAQFPERLTAEQKELSRDWLGELGALCKTPVALIIKLPNISASVPQLVDTIAELQSKGFNVPAFPSGAPATLSAEEKAIKDRYAKALGSSVNPVLREGNSDRRAAAPVKAFAQKNPHRLMAWPASTDTHVACMSSGDFFGTEKSVCMPADATLRIEFTPSSGGEKQVLKDGLKVIASEVVDAAVMSAASLRKFYETQIAEAAASGTLFSVHLKATMMKVSDPILFGHCVRAFFAPVFDKFAAAGVDTASIAAAANNGLQAVLDAVKKSEKISAAQKDEMLAAFRACMFEGEFAGTKRPDIAMVDSDRGITNLHVPSDIIIDASMPCVVRDGGCMWNKSNKLQSVKCVIPDRSYATMYQAVIEDVKAHGQFDVKTMGHVSNVGLMAQKAEEYGSHDKTFEMSGAGKVDVVNAATGEVLMSQAVEEGDIFRACQAKDAPIRDWVSLAVRRARACQQSGRPAKAIFWLDKERAHDRAIIAKVEEYLKAEDTTGLEVSVADPAAAMHESCTRARQGLDTISVTGNVLRDYLTDLFPILELGTSAKMLSIVPMLAGGAMYETGAGGSAPKHVQQFQQEGHLRWDSLGEYLALASCLDDMAQKKGDAAAKVAGETLAAAIGRVLDNNKSPSRKVREIDNRGTNFYLAMYWAQLLADRDAAWKDVADALVKNEATITKELVECQGPAVDLGGYFLPDDAKANAAMQSSPTLNKILASGAAGSM